MVQLALWSALTLMLGLIPNLGFIPIGPALAVTTVHIPVIIGAIMLGPAEGAFLGLLFGITSLIHNTVFVSITSFMFSPFVPFGNFYSVIIALVPRILVGVAAAYVYRFVAMKDKKGYIAALAAGIAGALTNTVLVLGGVYAFFGQHYAAAQHIPFKGLLMVLLGVVATNGIVEAVVAAVISMAVVKALFAAMKHI
jgi:Predicted membrane protein